MKYMLTIVLLTFTVSTYTETINDSNVRVREYPYLNMRIICKKNSGEEIQVLYRSDFEERIYETMNYWYFIKFNDRYGWMYGEFITELREPDEYRVFNFKLSRDKHIYDYDFQNNEFINLLDNKCVNRSEIRTKYDFGIKIACWFDSIEIRNANGSFGASNLIIKYRNDEKRIVLGDEMGYYYDESAFIKLSPNEKYLMVDQGTSHVRHIGIIDTDTGERILSGSYTNDIRYDGSMIVKYFRSGKRITGDKDSAIEFITENSVKDINGYGIKDKEFRERIDKSPSYSSFLFGDVYEFNTETGYEKRTGYILYYIDIE